MTQEHKIKLLPCPICNKMPKVIRDINSEAMSFGAWCTIQCKPLLGKPHLKVEEGKASWERAYMYAIVDWNDLVLSYKEREK